VSDRIVSEPTVLKEKQRIEQLSDIVEERLKKLGLFIVETEDFPEELYEIKILKFSDFIKLILLYKRRYVLKFWEDYFFIAEGLLFSFSAGSGLVDPEITEE